MAKTSKARGSTNYALDVSAPQDDGGSAPQLPPRPLDNDVKRLWVAYAKALGADSKERKRS